MARRFKRERVGREGARRAAKHVARKLIEHHDQREAALGGVFQMRKLAGGRVAVQLEKAAAHLAVECFVLDEPTLVRFSALAWRSEERRVGKECRFGV